MMTGIVTTTAASCAAARTEDCASAVSASADRAGRDRPVNALHQTTLALSQVSDMKRWYSRLYLFCVGSCPYTIGGGGMGVGA